MQKKQRVAVQSTQSIINLRKSKRLAAMRESVERLVDNDKYQTLHSPGASKKESQIQKARDVIAQRVIAIKATYPSGKQNKLFALRYGSEEKINNMSLKKLYALLNISQELAKQIAEVKYGSAKL